MFSIDRRSKIMKIYIVIIEVSIPWVGMQLGKNGGFCVSMKNLSLFYRLHIKKKKLSVGKVLVIPTLEMQRPADPWGSLASPPIL